MRTACRGFSLMELCVVVTILSLLFLLAIPAYRGMRRAAVAAKAVSVYHTLEEADWAFYAANERFSLDSGANYAATTASETELAGYLPKTFMFHDRDFWVRKWTTTSAPNAAWSDSMDQVGAMFTSADTAIVRRIYLLTRTTGWNTYLATIGGACTCVTQFAVMPHHPVAGGAAQGGGH